VYSDEVERFYQEGLDSVLDQSLSPRGPELLYQIAGQLGVPTAGRVLDLGSRDGQHLVSLADRFGWRTFGVEPAPANLAQSQLVAPGLPVARAVGERLPFRSGVFDLVWVRDVLIHVEPLVDAFAEMGRVLRPGSPALVFHVSATPLLEPGEARRLFGPLGVVPSSVDAAAFEAAVATAGLRIERREVLHGEWREHGEEVGDDRTSRQLLRVARMVRQPERYQSLIGEAAYQVELANCLYGVYQLLGKLSASIYVLR